MEADSVTMNNVLKLYSAGSDMAAMEKFLNEWEAVREIRLEWLTTLEMAQAYLRAGSRENAMKMLSL